MYGSSPDDRPPVAALLLVLGIAAQLLWIHWTTLAHFGHMPPGRGLMSLPAYAALVAGIVPLGPCDAVRLGLLSATLVSGVVHEVRRRGLSRLLAAAPAIPPAPAGLKTS